MTTQRLALQDIFYRRQTLTSIHDKSAAWLGLGSSAFAVLRQKSLATDRMGVVVTLCYLLFISIVHTIFPSVFILVTASESGLPPIDRPTVLAYQNLRYVFTSCYRNVDTYISCTSNVSQIDSDVYNFLNEYNHLNDSPAGLANQKIYDIFPSDVAGHQSGTWLSLNSTSFSVNCTYISGETLRYNSSASPLEQQNISGPNDVPFTIDLGATMSNNVTLFPMCRSRLLSA